MGKKFAEYSKLDLSEVNGKVLKKWDENQVFAKSMTEREGCPSFVFFEGPPSANGMPGIHHVMARSIKDIFCRYKTMKGFQVKRKAGWDTHGLPVELGVEKALGITKEDIGKTISVAEYNAACRKDVMKFTKEWEDLDGDGINDHLYAVWNPTAGIEEILPELDGADIGNSMWSSASNMKSVSNAALGQVGITRFLMGPKNNFWIKGMGDFTYHATRDGIDGCDSQWRRLCRGCGPQVHPEHHSGRRLRQPVRHQQEPQLAQRSGPDLLRCPALRSMEKAACPQGHADHQRNSRLRMDNQQAGLLL